MRLVLGAKRIKRDARFGPEADTPATQTGCSFTLCVDLRCPNRQKRTRCHFLKSPGCEVVRSANGVSAFAVT